MLKHRVITALILMPLVILGILKLPHALFAAIVAGVALLGAWEWCGFTQLRRLSSRALYLLGGLVIGLVLTWIIHHYPNRLQIILTIITLWWLVSVLLIVQFNRRGYLFSPEPMTLQQRAIVALIGYLVLAGIYIGLITVRQFSAEGPVLVLAMMVLIWTADIAAYFTGRAWGKHKLARQVSPGKSWEGVAGALLASLVAAYLFARYFGFEHAHAALFIGICLVTVVFSIVGDLNESLFKRQVGLKDSGKLLPGHGGVLDRVDSLTSAAPIFAFSMMISGLA